VNQSKSYYCLTQIEIINLLNFNAKTGVPMVFGLSVGYPLFPTNLSVPWNYTDGI